MKENELLQKIEYLENRINDIIDSCIETMIGGVTDEKLCEFLNRWYLKKVESETFKENIELKKRIHELEERLEIDCDHDYDGIYCRDETIKLLESKLQEYKNKLGDSDDSTN
jgi:BMFP domain-containing protein YqiC